MNRFNPNVPPADWPFIATRKRENDIVISAIAPTETGTAKTVKQGLVRRMMAGLAPKDSTQ
jgi:hypothetical protein